MNEAIVDNISFNNQSNLGSNDVNFDGDKNDVSGKIQEILSFINSDTELTDKKIYNSVIQDNIYALYTEFESYLQKKDFTNAVSKAKGLKKYSFKFSYSLLERCLNTQFQDLLEEQNFSKAMEVADRMIKNDIVGGKEKLRQSFICEFQSLMEKGEYVRANVRAEVMINTQIKDTAIELFVNSLPLACEEHNKRGNYITVQTMIGKYKKLFGIQ